MLSKYNGNEENKFASVYFNSTTFLDFYRTDNWISTGSGWVTETVDDKYVNISVYSPVSGYWYIIMNYLMNWNTQIRVWSIFKKWW